MHVHDSTSPILRHTPATDINSLELIGQILGSLLSLIYRLYRSVSYVSVL